MDLFDITRDDWGAQPPNRGYVSISSSSRPGLESHHSVGLYGTSDPATFAYRCQRDHLGRNWTDIFYNVLIWTDGTIIEGRPASAKSGPISSLTVCFAGNYNRRKLTDAQKSAWLRVRTWARKRGVGTDISWHGQRDAVSCPGKSVISWHQNGTKSPSTWSALMAELTEKEQEVLKSFAREVVKRKSKGSSIAQQFLLFHRNVQPKLESLLGHIKDKRSSVQGFTRGSINLFRAAKDDYKVDTR